jgi:hypothetical protein
VIYFAQMPNGAIKIGFSENVPARMRDLKKYYGVDLALLHVEDGGRRDEIAWHNRFSHLRLGRTEQFRPASDLMAAIGRPLLVGVNPDTVEVKPIPATAPVIVNFRGTEEYRAFLEVLAAKVGASNLCELLDIAVAMMAAKYGMVMPPRTRPVGWNRFSNGPATGEGGGR